MFSIGIGAFANIPDGVWWEDILWFVATWFLWPLLLGTHVAG